MRLMSWADSKLKKLDWIDMALTKMACFAFGVMLAILFPKILEINILWISAAWILLAIRPLFNFFK